MAPIIRKLGSLLALFITVVATGCSETAQTPLSAVPSAPSLNSSDMASLARFRQKPQITIAWAKKWIGPEGGRLDFQGFAIEVPAGAVDKVTMFSIRLPVDPNAAEHVVAEFGPHNVRFNTPVAVELPFRGTSIEASPAPTVVWWDEGWVDVGGDVTTDGQRLRTTSDTFSTYGTTDVARGGTFVTGGG
jgi:hypothetical protein